MRVAATLLAVALLSSVSAADEDVPWNQVGPFPPEFTAKSGAEWVLNGRAEAIDGDSIRFNGVNMRLLGIHAPEMDQVCFMPRDIPWGCGVAARSNSINSLRVRRSAVSGTAPTTTGAT